MTDLQRLADYVKARRDEKDWSQLDVYDQGGPSNSTLTAIENAVKEPSRATLRKLDRGLQWAAGSARRIFEEGGEPDERLTEDRRDEAWVRDVVGEARISDAKKARIRDVLDDVG